LHRLNVISGLLRDRAVGLLHANEAQKPLELFNGRSFELELSIDETRQPTSLAEHYIRIVPAEDAARLAGDGFGSTRVIQDLLARVVQPDQCVVRKATALEAAEACNIVSEMRESQAMEASEDLPNAGTSWRELAVELQAAAKR
jgi:hypothetical protein